MFRGYEDENGKAIMDKEYLDHAVFESLNATAQFYHSLAYSVMHFVSKWVKNSSIINYDSYFFGALANSIDSIKAVLELGHITDAKALLRNFFDEAIVNLYFLARLKRKDDEILNLLATDDSATVLNIEELYDTSTSDWLSEKKTRNLLRALRYDEMVKYLKQEECLAGIVEYLESSECKDMRNWLNDAVHLNHYKAILLNDGLLCLDSARKSAVEEFDRVFNQITMFHIICIFCLSPVYMMSSDYLDYKECGMEPPEGCQYEVAPFIQSYLDKTVYKIIPDWADKLVDAVSPMRLRKRVV